ncbi:DMT family transporter [Lysinibacillus sp. 3P01SB]|uniref:DMT family transporter n=1 Tax=Lysinibacillus sp. 3P01SB TaxID=3132284 RepID=UPI0039A71B74
MKGYMYLSISILAEIAGTFSLKFSEGFTVLLPSIIVVIGYGLAFYMLSKSLTYMPLSLAYAIWSGVGTALTAVLGIVFLDDPLSLAGILGILCIIGGVVLMNNTSNEHDSHSLEKS